MAASPDEVNLLDVRTPEECIFVGHPETARCIPLGFQNYRWDDEKGYYALDVNQEFVAQVRERFDPGEILLLMCRSGGRSAMAVNLLAKTGCSTHDQGEVIITVITFGLLCRLTYLIFVSGERIISIVGPSAIDVITKMMGLILAVIGMQMFIEGVDQAVKSFS